MRWNDRVYGDSAIDDSGLIALIECPTFQRLKQIRQAGPSAFAFPFKTVTRFEHSLGVYLLLRRFGADLREQVAGLLHDISHTAFSHAVDFVFASEEHDHHEQLKPLFLKRPDMVEALKGLGFEPEEFFDDSIYPLLERPLPELCADRVDYFFRDSLACDVTTPSDVTGFLNDLEVVDNTIVFKHVEIAKRVAKAFSVMNQNWWASEIESYIYNEFADILREGFRGGDLVKDDLLSDDTEVMNKLRASSSPVIRAKLEHILHFDEKRLEGFSPQVLPKNRWIDPPVRHGRTFKNLSQIQ